MRETFGALAPRSIAKLVVAGGRVRIFCIQILPHTSISYTFAINIRTEILGLVVLAIGYDGKSRSSVINKVAG